MDVLSRILDSVELRSSLYYVTELRAPWGLRVPGEAVVCRFHVVAEGSLYLTSGGETRRLGRGDLALVPRGREHVLKDDPETPVTDLPAALEECGWQGEETFRWGGDGGLCRLVCGHFDFDREAAHPLLDALPPLVHVQATPTYDFRWIDQVMRFIGEESHAQRPGGGVIARRLSEVLFVQVLRHYAETSPRPVPILAGLTDPRLSRALKAMHDRLGSAWSVEALAREAGMSRTAFTVRFGELLGATPMKYLTEERMREAMRLLRAGVSVAAVAHRVGYKSEAAFARKFKDFSGRGPGAYRRRTGA
jgi:AraC-like DNA-binding protein